MISRCSIVILALLLACSPELLAQTSTDEAEELRQEDQATACVDKCEDGVTDCDANCRETTERESEGRDTCFGVCKDNGRACSETCGPLGLKVWNDYERIEKKDKPPENPTDKEERYKRTCRVDCGSAALSCDESCKSNSSTEGDLLRCYQDCQSHEHGCQNACGD